MKKQVLFAVCLTAASTVVLTGCMTKQEAAAQRAQMEATEISEAETQAMEASVCEETLPEVTPTAPATPEVAPVEEAKPVPQAVRPQPVSYKVTAGDSVTALAVRFGVRKADILALNPALRGNPNNLRVGQTLLFPAGTDVTKKAQRRETSAPPANAKRPAGTTVYTVKSGDVLGGIAIAHGVTVADIKKANNLKKDTIWVGQKLTIPGATKKPAGKKVAKPAEKKPAKPAEKKPDPIVTPEDPVTPPAPVVEEATPPAAPVIEELPMQNGEDALLPPEPVVEEVVQPEAPAQSGRVHVVEAGEDIVGIALKWNVTPQALRELNNLDISAELVPGMTLRLPMPSNVQ